MDHHPWWGSREPLALTISEAATICGVKRRTIRRRHQAGEFEHAFKDAQGAWRIPVSDLVASGLRPNVVTDPDEPRIVFSASSQIERLRTEVAVLRERVRALEVIAREREERVTDLRTILRMLPPPKEAEQAPPASAKGPWAVEAAEEPQGVQAEESPVAQIAPEPSHLVEARPDHGVASPLEAPSPAGVSTATASPPSEPLLVLPDSPASLGEPEEPGLGDGPEVPAQAMPPEQVPGQPSEGLGSPWRGPADLLQDAMSIWWPTPVGKRPVDRASSPESPAQSEWRDDWMPGPMTEDPQEPVAEPQQDAGDPVESPSRTPEESGSLAGREVDESSFDWVDPDFGHPPRHRRRRLGRFFRRSRRPR